MNEKTRKGLVFGALILALIWAYFSFADPKKKEPEARREEEPAEVVQTPPPASPISGAITDSLYHEYEAKSWGENPFYNGYRPASGPTLSKKVELHLLGVLVREYRAHALINGHIVEVGDEIEGFRVTDITRDSVILDNGETTLTLWVTKESS